MSERERENDVMMIRVEHVETERMLSHSVAFALSETRGACVLCVQGIERLV